MREGLFGHERGLLCVLLIWLVIVVVQRPPWVQTDRFHEIITTGSRLILWHNYKMAVPKQLMVSGVKHIISKDSKPYSAYFELLIFCISVPSQNNAN